MANNTLGSAKKARKDEFYTQYIDIQKEVEAYLEFDEDTHGFIRDSHLFTYDRNR